MTSMVYTSDISSGQTMLRLKISQLAIWNHLAGIVKDTINFDIFRSSFSLSKPHLHCVSMFPAIITQTSKVITLDCFTLFLHKKLLGFGFPTSNKHFNKPI